MNYYQRNFMQYLRSGSWVSVSALPDSPNTKAKLVKLGWVEQRGRGPEVCYRITEIGLAELKAPIPLRKSTVPINGGLLGNSPLNAATRIQRRLPVDPKDRQQRGGRPRRAHPHRKHQRGAFDILVADGDDLRKLPYTPQEQPRRLLARRVNGIFLSDFEQGEIGPDLFRAACKLGLEGMVSKRRDRLYRAGRSPDWIKVKSEAIPR